MRQDCAQLKHLTQSGVSMALSSPTLGQVTTEWPQQPALCPGIAGSEGCWMICPLRKISRCSCDWQMAQKQLLRKNIMLQAPVMILSYSRTGRVVWILQFHLTIMTTVGTYRQLICQPCSLPHTSGCTPAFCDHVFPFQDALSVYLALFPPAPISGAREKADAMTPLCMRWGQTSPGPTSKGVLLKQGGQYTLLSILHNSLFLSPFPLLFPFPLSFMLLLLCLLLLHSLQLPANTTNEPI